MNILLNGIQRLALFAGFCVAWLNVPVLRPVEALSAEKKTVLVLYGDRLSIPAVKMIEQGLTASLFYVGSRRLRLSQNTLISHVSRWLSMGTMSCVICAQGMRRES